MNAIRPRSARYLPASPIVVLAGGPEGIDVVVIDDRRGPCHVTWRPDTGWGCSCAAATVACGHVGAARALVALPSTAVPAATDPDATAEEPA